MIESIFNTIIFNPPYLPDEGKEIDIALDGGPNRRRYIDKFILKYKKYIEKDYVVLLLESSLDNYSQDLKKGFEITASERFFFEELVVLKIVDRKP
jgi:release factor glutamine methyltransferase